VRSARLTVSDRRRRVASVAAALSLLILVAIVSACGDPKLSYSFVDGDHHEYRLSVAVAEKAPNGQALGTVTLEALLRTDVNVDTKHPCACFVTVDYEDAKISTTGSAQYRGNHIPRTYFHLCEDRLLTFNGPAWRGGSDSVELARTGPNGSFDVMLLNTFVAKCFGQPRRDSFHQLKIGSEWTTIGQCPGEFVTYTYTDKRPTGDQNRETTQVKVTGLTPDDALAELAWTSVTPLGCSRQKDLTESLLESGMDPSEIAYLCPGGAAGTLTMSGCCSCSGVAFVRMSDGWPQRASVDRMTVDLTSSWMYPDDLLTEEPEPVETILDITGSIEAI
jgi:hypothetical protein